MGNLLPSALSSRLPSPRPFLGHPLLSCPLAWSNDFFKEKANYSQGLEVRNTLLLESDLTDANIHLK